MNVAIIPARGGSKRIPRKNIKNFCGQPIIAYSIQTAIMSKLFDKIVVSTDDDEIASVARQYGATVPFIRPPHLSDDYAGTIPVIKHAIEQLISSGDAPTAVCCIYATAPFIQSEDIIKSEQLLADSEYVFPVTSFASPVQRALYRNADHTVGMFQPEHFYARSQDLRAAFHDAGQFYWGKTQAWLDEIPVYTGKTKTILLPRNRVQDIDTPEDWAFAEYMYQAMNLSQISS